MSRERNDVEGVLIVDKPADWTSHDVVAKLRGFFQIKKIGHAGTLDPMATGLLAVLCGKSTKLSDALMASPKTYQMAARFGIETNTQDITGETVAEKPLPENFSKETLEKAMEGFRGEILQTPPMFSALKINGQKLYKAARSGKEIEREKRPVTIYDFRLLTLKGNEASFTCRCSKGTYVRTLAHDLGQKLGCGAALTSLRRTEGCFSAIEEGHTLDELLSWDLGKLREEAQKGLEKITTALNSDANSEEQ